jgi:hypothetical protein
MRSLLLCLGFSSAAAILACSTSSTEPVSQDDDIRSYSPREVEGVPIETSVNGFYIGGYEYWPFKEEQPLYPSKIQWGYEAGSEPAKKCMAASKRALVEILQNPPAELLELKRKTGISSFFNWNNDYTGAEADGMASSNFRVLWLYNGRLMKWISETNRDGNCRLPERSDLRALARDCLKRLEQQGQSGGTLYCNAANTANLPPEPVSDAGAPRDASTDR